MRHLRRCTSGLPSIREHVAGGDGLADNGIGQEQDGKMVLDELDKTEAAEPGFDALLGTFIRLARIHIQFEEGTVWPQARTALSADLAARLGMRITEGSRHQAGAPPFGVNETGRKGRSNDSLWADCR